MDPIAQEEGDLRKLRMKPPIYLTKTDGTDSVSDKRQAGVLTGGDWFPGLAITGRLDLRG